MRVIGGQWKGRRLNIPSKSWPVRPTTDFAREALFNILDNRLDYHNSSALDLFGGTGIHSIELASRGCLDITYVDRYRESVRFMNTMIQEWQMPITAIQSDVFDFIKKADRQWDYVFADPPYDLKNQEGLVSGITGRLLTNTGFFVLEHTSKINFTHMPGFMEARNYGQSVFSFFKQGS